jgi:proline racemase
VYRHVIRTVDTHTAGEPTRVVISGFPFLRGTMADKRRQLARDHDHLRTALMHEPRGHADMFGAVVMEPSRSEADLGVVFMDTGGYLAMCGHGSIGVVAAALAAGLVEAQAPTTHVVMDTPAGLVQARAAVSDGAVTSIALENVPSFLYERDVEVKTRFGSVSVDISFGGNFFALVAAHDLGLEVTTEALPQLTDYGMAIRSAVNDQVAVVHPAQPHIDSVDLVEIYQDLDGAVAHCRNVVVFGESQVDRSPCGTGTSAKMAALYAKGRLGLNQRFINESILGTRFTGTLLGKGDVAGRPAVIPEITGSAYVTGFQRFVIDAADPLASGFLLTEGVA